MPTNDDLEAIIVPSRKSHLTARDILGGKKFDAVTQIKMYSDKEYEIFICEWVSSLQSEYTKVVRSKGKGDKGRDIAAFVEDKPDSEWDNYQCKHYDHALAPSDIWIELGKHIYYCFKCEFRPARKFYFVAPQGVGNLLQGFLEKPDVLKENLKAAWSANCEKKIQSATRIPLSGALETYLDHFDFSIFSSVEPQTVVDQHSSTIHRAQRFGGGLSPRPPVKLPPESVDGTEQRYTGELVAVYSEREGSKLTLLEVQKHTHHGDHFNRQRRYFYHAESLRQFAKDTLEDNGNFEDLQEQIYDGVVAVVDSDHKDALERLNNSLTAATSTQLSEHVLISEVKPADRSGICHQLVNDGRLRWIKRR